MGFIFYKVDIDPQQILSYKGMQVFPCNDGKVDRSSKSEFIFQRMVSYFPNRSKPPQNVQKYENDISYLK